jgi:hypothetical protein
VVEPGAGGAELKFLEGAGAEVLGDEVAVGAENRGELQGFTSGAGAGVEPASAGGDRSGGENQLRTEILDFDEAGEKGVGFGDIGIGEQFERAGEDGGRTGGLAEAREFGEYGCRVGRLQAEPDGGASVQGVEVGRDAGGGAMTGQPSGQEQ